MAVNGTKAVNGDCAAPRAVPESVNKALGLVVEGKAWKKPRFQIESGSKAGDGYLSVLHRVVIENEDDADSVHLMCKTVLPAMQGSLFISHVFKVEGFIYNKVLPAMEELCQLKHPLPWPRGYPNPVEPPCLVMEDLRPDGFAISKRGTVMGDTHARHFVTQIARFHGAGMALDQLRPDLIAEYRATVEDPAILDDLKEKFSTFIPVYRSAPDLIADRFEGTPTWEKLVSRCGSFYDDFFDVLIPPDPEGGNAIVHGDAHINNIMFQLDEAGAATGCRLVDFQASRYGWPTPDLALILLAFTEKPTRDAHWQEWMRLYHDTLQATLRDAGIADPDRVYSWERFQVHIRRAALLAMVFVPVLVYGFTEAEAIKEIQDVVLTLANNNGEANGEAPPPPPPENSFSLKPTPSLKRRFGDVVQDLVEWGWL